MLRFGKFRNKVVETGSNAAGQVSRNVAKAGERGSEAARGAYGYVMNHPKTATAVVLGTGVAAALLWAMRRNGGYSETRRQVLERVRTAGQSAKKKTQEFAHSE
jgi:hypothetical protein